MIMIKMCKEYLRKMSEKNPQIKKWKLIVPRIIKIMKVIKEIKKWM